MNSRDITVWLDERWYDALSRQLNKKDTIREVGKCISKAPVTGAWEPNRCPTCDADLGGDCDDGYYENPWYDRCPKCGQRLDM